MGLIARQSAKAGLVTYAGVAIGVVNSLYIYTKMLRVDQLGEIIYMYSSVAMLAPFLVFGLGSVLVKYYPQVKDDAPSKNTLFTLVFGLVLLNVVLFASIALVFREALFQWLSNGEAFLLATSFAIVGMTSMQAFIQLATSLASLRGRIAVPAVLIQIIKVVQPALVLSFYLDICSFETVIYAMLGYYVVLAAAYLIYTLSLHRFSLSLDVKKLPFSLRSAAVFALFSVLGSVGAVLTNQVDVLMITNMLGKYETGLYGWSLFFSTVIAIPYGLIGAVSTPLISQYWKDGNVAEINTVYKQSSSTLLVLSLGFFACIYAGLDELFALMPRGEEYMTAKTLIVLLCVAKIIDMGSGLNDHIIGMSSSYKYLLVFLLITAFCNVGLNAMLIPKYGVNGSAIATVCSIILYNLLKFFFLKSRLQLNPFGKKTLQIIGVGLLVILGVSHLPRMSLPWLNLIVFSGGTFSLYFFLAYKMKLAPELNNFATKQLKRIGIIPKFNN